MLPLLLSALLAATPGPKTKASDVKPAAWTTREFVTHAAQVECEFNKRCNGPKAQAACAQAQRLEASAKATPASAGEALPLPFQRAAANACFAAIRKMKCPSGDLTRVDELYPLLPSCKKLKDGVEKLKEQVLQTVQGGAQGQAATQGPASAETTSEAQH